MRKEYFLIVILSILCGLRTSANTLPEDPYLSKISVQNVYYTNMPSQDDILAACIKAEEKARVDINYRKIFQIEYIAINAMCIKGDMNTAIIKADKMYKSAKSQKDSVGIVLSLESLGNIYLYSGLDNQALSTFIEAEAYLGNNPNPEAEMQLLIQLTQASFNLQKFADAFVYISRAQRLLQIQDIKYETNYQFYISCYNALFNIASNNEEIATTNLEEIKNLENPDGIYDRWIDYVSYRYYLLKKDYDQALKYCELAFNNQTNPYTIAIAMYAKANILEQLNKHKDASALYLGAKTMVDTVYTQSNISKIDSMLIAYGADNIKMQNEVGYETLVDRIVIYLAIVVMLLVVIFFAVRSRNKKVKLIRQQLTISRKEEVESVKTQGKLISTTSHELRAPLSAIVGFSSILADSDDIDKETRIECANYIKHNSETLAGITTGILDAHYLQKRSIQFNMLPCNIVDVCKECINTLKNDETIKRNAINVNLTAIEPNIEVTIDRDYFKKVIDNLLSNSLKFTSSGIIAIEADVAHKSKEAIIIVKDSGCGIPSDKHDFVFQSFTKLNDNIPGIGIGLTICKDIIEQMDGNIRIEKSPSIGTTIVITFPLTNGTK